MKKNLFLLSFLLNLTLPFYAFSQNNPAPSVVDNNVKQADLPVAVNAAKPADATPAQNQLNDPLKNNKNELVNSLLGKKKASSLMFDEEEIDGINRALDSLKSGQAFVPDDSLMTDAEKKARDQKFDSEKNAQKKVEEDNKKSFLYLGSVLYYSPQDWAIWINDVKVASNDNHPKKEFFVRAIDSESVKVRWSLGISKWKILTGKNDDDQTPPVNADNQVVINFTLRPNQTYVLGTNSVVEGRVLVRPKTNTTQTVQPEALQKKS